MNHFRCNRNLGMLAALVGTMFLATYQVRAQNPGTPKTDFEVVAGQAQDPLSRWMIAGADLTPNWEKDFLVAELQNPMDELLGATLQPVGDTLRAQVDIPAGQGLLVTDVRAEGASARAGLKQNDILLSLADKPLASADDVTKQLKAAGEAPVALKILRRGKAITIQVRPIYRVTIGPVTEHKAEYYIGISVNAADDAIRAQLGLPAGQGVVVGEVVGGSPAEKAGIKKHDIVLELNGKPLDKPETLAHQVQAAKDHPITLRLLRAGKPVVITVTAAMRKMEARTSQEASVVLWLAGQPNLASRAVRSRNVWWQPQSDDLRHRLELVEKELNAVRAALDKINETLKAEKKGKQD
jgi:membrane-associated protease RseP (regulator of RpoE activity)